MKSIVSISFLLGAFVSTISSTSEYTVTLRALTSHEPDINVDITLPFGVFKPLEHPIQAFRTWFTNVQHTAPGFEERGCLLFRDAAGTDALEPIFNLPDESQEVSHDPPVPEQISSLICLKADDPKLHVKSARKSRRAIRGRTVLEPPEHIDGIEPIYESGIAAWADIDLPAALAEHAQPLTNAGYGGTIPSQPEQVEKPATDLGGGGALPPHLEQEKKPATEPYFQPSTGGRIYPDGFVIPHQEEWPAV